MIYISNTIKQKNIKHIYDKSYPINISLKKKDLLHLVKNYINKNKEIDYEKLIEKSNNNLHSVKVNLEFHEENVYNIESINKDLSDYNLLTNDIYTKNIKEFRQIIDKILSE